MDERIRAAIAAAARKAGAGGRFHDGRKVETAAGPVRVGLRGGLIYVVRSQGTERELCFYLNPARGLEDNLDGFRERIAEWLTVEPGDHIGP